MATGLVYSYQLLLLQAQRPLFKSVLSGSVLPVPVPIQPIANNESSVRDQSIVGKSNPEPETKAKMQESSGAPLNQIQKPSHVSFISHRASISLHDSKSMGLVHHTANSSNVKIVQVHDVISASAAAKPVVVQPLPTSLTQVIDSCSKESLSRPDLIKANNKVWGKKGQIELPHQVFSPYCFGTYC